jgi:NTP pyrophosphatase (non-canonical NTP hydrolase)
MRDDGFGSGSAFERFYLASEKKLSTIETLDRYQVEALRTVGDSNLAILGLGVAGEAGEVADLIKKELGHGHAADPVKMAKEIGDVLWYLAVLSDQYGYSLSAIASMNIEKLKARYPEGFSSEASINRGTEDT